MAGSSGRREKDLRKFSRRIVSKKEGKHFGVIGQSDYYKATGNSACVCGSLKVPRGNKYLIPSRVFGMCNYSPHGRINVKSKLTREGGVPKEYEMGVCQGTLPMTWAEDCPYKNEFLAKNKFNRIKDMDGVEFANGTAGAGLFGYVRWGSNHLAVEVRVDVENKRIRDINVLGTLEGVQINGDRVVEEIAPIANKKKGKIRRYLSGLEIAPIRKNKVSNVRRLLGGLEDRFSEEIGNWLLSEEEAVNVYGNKKDFCKRVVNIRLAS